MTDPLVHLCLCIFQFSFRHFIEQYCTLPQIPHFQYDKDPHVSHFPEIGFGDEMMLGILGGTCCNSGARFV